MSTVTTRDLYRLKKFYLEKIRGHSKAETVGVFRQMQGLLKRGFSFEDLDRALTNYAAYECDVRFRKHIRRFFTPEVIRAWQTPHPSSRKAAEIVVLERLRTDTVPADVTWPVFDEREEDIRPHDI